MVYGVALAFRAWFKVATPLAFRATITWLVVAPWVTAKSTLPVGVPAPAPAAVTVAVIVASPYAAFALLVAIAVFVFALLTVCTSGAEVLTRLLPLPW